MMEVQMWCLRLICEHFFVFDFFLIEFLVRSCLKRTWCKHVHFRSLLHRPALKTKTSSESETQEQISIPKKDNPVPNNHNEHDDDALTNIFSPSQINNDQSYLTPENQMDLKMS